ncbi:MAG TPA: hypothetical protein VIS48_05830 [Candidatus Kryptonia bacterium]
MVFNNPGGSARANCGINKGTALENASHKYGVDKLFCIKTGCFHTFDFNVCIVIIFRRELRANLKSPLRLTVLAAAILFVSCGSTRQFGGNDDRQNHKESCAAGTIYVIGNEPFTRLALEYSGACGESDDSLSLFTSKQMLTIAADTALTNFLMTLQGRSVEVHYDSVFAVPGGKSIHVIRAELMK